MANTKISALTANTNPNWSEEFVYAYNNANGKITLNTMKTYANTWQQAALVSGVNIKTINNTSILWSWNIDVSWGWGGSAEPTELWGDANIWELSEWWYVTAYDLYYTTGNKVQRMSITGASYKQMIFVAEESTGEKWFLVFNIWHKSTSYREYAGFWYSISSSVWEYKALWAWDAAITGITLEWTAWIDQLDGTAFTQIVTAYVQSSDNGKLRVGTLYSGMTYNIYVASYDTGESCTISLGTWVTNPLNITLPSGTNKPFFLTVLATSSSTAIVTSCTIQA